MTSSVLFHLALFFFFVIFFKGIPLLETRKMDYLYIRPSEKTFEHFCGKGIEKTF